MRRECWATEEQSVFLISQDLLPSLVWQQWASHHWGFETWAGDKFSWAWLCCCGVFGWVVSSSLVSIEMVVSTADLSRWKSRYFDFGASGEFQKSPSATSWSFARQDNTRRLGLHCFEPSTHFKQWERQRSDFSQCCRFPWPRAFPLRVCVWSCCWSSKNNMEDEQRHPQPIHSDWAVENFSTSKLWEFFFSIFTSVFEKIMSDFGEICLWCGIFLTCSNGYETLGQYISVLSPIFTALLLINVSGV